MPGRFDNYFVKWAEGRGNNLAKSKNRADAWGVLKKSLSKPHVTPESRKQFDKMSKDEQDTLKASNGWICGAQARDQKRTKANMLPRNLITIDVDYAPEYFPELITDGLTGISHFEAFWHSSRRHTLEAPRVRLFMPMTREVTMDEYIALARYTGWLLDNSMKLVDYVSYRPAQMMFKPSCSRDDEKIFFKHEQFGTMFDPDKMLAAFDKQFGSWMDLSCLPRSPDEDNLRQSADKAEDPRGKAGPVGVFCRTYDIFQAMEEFLPGVYIPGDEHSGHPRFTYRGSTSSNGAIVYDDGLFLFSHHGHDPVGDMNVNAFDLVRIHLFGDKDDKAPEGTSPGKMPSYAAMMETLKTNKPYQKTRRDERFAGMVGAFSDVEEDESDDDEDRSEWAGESDIPDAEGTDDADEEDVVGGSTGDADDLSDDDPVGQAGETQSDANGPSGAGLFDDIEPDPDVLRPETAGKRPDAGVQGRPRPKPSRPRPKPSDDWFTEKVTFSAEDTPKVLQTLNNAAMILQSDMRLFRSIRFNQFTQKIVLAKDIDSLLPTFAPIKCEDKVNGDKWQDHHEVVVRAILDAPTGENQPGYGFQASKINIDHALVLAARSAPFHPVKDYLLKLKWDGKPRVDKMLVKYLKCPNTEYHRQISRLMMVASVTRVFEPGHKFDFAVIIQGPQGARKSTLIQTLYGEKWFGELHVDLGEQQRVAEAVMGKWGIELPELGSLHKSDHNKAKAFMRQQRDDVRLAYEKNSADLPRQFICWGTTNDKKYLRDPTGNRSFWPCLMGRVRVIDTDSLIRERDQLWAEAFEMYWKMRDEKPTGTLPLYLQGDEANAEALELQEGARTEELHETWAAAIRIWLETPILLSQLQTEITGKDKSAYFTEGDHHNPLVLRTVFTQTQAAELALHRTHTKGIVADSASAINISKAVDLLEGWISPRTPRTKGTASRRVMGTLGRWVENTSATKEEIAQGYAIVETDDFDVI